MKKVFNFIKFAFFKSAFETDHIVDFSKFSYDDLCIQLSNFDKVVKFEGNAMMVTWESANTILVIKYNYDGNFIEKVSEKWK